MVSVLHQLQRFRYSYLQYLKTCLMFPQQENVSRIFSLGQRVFIPIWHIPFHCFTISPKVVYIWYDSAIFLFFIFPKCFQQVNIGTVGNCEQKTPRLLRCFLRCLLRTKSFFTISVCEKIVFEDQMRILFDCKISTEKIEKPDYNVEAKIKHVKAPRTNQ